MPVRSSRGTTRRAPANTHVIEVDYEDYTPEREYVGEEPRPGLLRLKCVNIEHHTAESSGNEGIKWTFECTEEPYAGWWGYIYSDLNPEGSKWKTQQTTRALQAGSEKPVKIDLKNPEKFLKSCKEVVGRIINEEYKGEDRAKIRKVMVLDPKTYKKRSASEDEEDDFEEDEDGFEDDEEAEEDEYDEEEETDEDEDEDQEDEDEEEEEPEPEPAPARRRTKKAAPAATKRASATRRTRR